MTGRHQPESQPTDPVHFILHEGVISFVSSASVEASGISPEELKGRPVLDLVHPDDHEQLLQYFAPGWEGVLQAMVRVQDVRGEWQRRRVEGVRTLDTEGHASAVFTLTKVDPFDGRP